MFIFEDIIKELEMRTSRSSGKGGQNVNKVSTKVELRFNIPDSSVLLEEEKLLLREKLGSRLTKKGELVVTASSERSQLANRKKALIRMQSLLERAFEVQKKRIPTRQPRSANEKRLNLKMIQAVKKHSRRSPGGEE